MPTGPTGSRARKLTNARSFRSPTTLTTLTTLTALAEVLGRGEGPLAAEPLDVRRSIAVGVIADPARALALLQPDAPRPPMPPIGSRPDTTEPSSRCWCTCTPHPRPWPPANP